MNGALDSLEISDSTSDAASTNHAVTLSALTFTLVCDVIPEYLAIGDLEVSSLSRFILQALQTT